MSTHSRLIGIGTALALLAPVAVIADSEDKLQRLEELAEQQLQRIEQLEQQVAASRQEQTDEARADVMRAQIREILSEQEFRESLMPSLVQAGYDKGFFIRSSDGNFEMKINGRVQFRWTHYATRASNRYLSPGLQRDDRTGFDVQRLRLGFKGHVYDPDLTYRIEMQGDGGSDVTLRYAWINYRFREEFQFMAGIFKIASTRGQMTSSANLQFVDRPMTDAVFQLDRGLGVRLWGRLFDKRLDYYVDVVNSFNSTGNRTITNDPAELDSNPGIVFHTVWHALGENPGTDFKAQGDLEHHESPALDLGFHYAFNDDQGDARTSRIPVHLPRHIANVGGFGLVSSNGLQLHQFGFEAAFKWRGFSATSEYFLRILDVRRANRMPYTPLFLATGEESTVAQHGAYLQVGYFLPIPGLENKLEAVGRVGGVAVNTEGSEGTWEYGAGLNYYIKGNSIKLQTDMMKVSEVPITSNSHSLANVNDDALVFRVQLQVAF